MIVDDEAVNVRVTRKYLQQDGYEDFITTTDSTEALELIARELPDLVLLDIVMPKVSGLYKRQIQELTWGGEPLN